MGVVGRQQRSPCVIYWAFSGTNVVVPRGRLPRRGTSCQFTTHNRSTRKAKSETMYYCQCGWFTVRDRYRVGFRDVIPSTQPTGFVHWSTSASLSLCLVTCEGLKTKGFIFIKDSAEFCSHALEGLTISIRPVTYVMGADGSTVTT